MFRLESYITSIITGYIDRYISNFKRQDAQVSLWEGDALLKNLDLDLDAVNQELNLPFSLVSGHIHELHIHVPYTKITSEPVVITINTIECVLKLKPPGQANAQKKKKVNRAANSPEEPTAANRGLLFRIVSNLHVTCNNLILKYVEEDIVLSMNIKKVHALSVDKYWNSMFTALSPENLILRKLITLTDITVCLDKRNASGRIESYLDPILYKCSLKIRVSRTFSPLNFSLLKTRIAFHSDNVSISISEPQVPMLLRLILLAKITFTSSRNSSFISSHSSEGLAENNGEESAEGETWGSWMWSMLPSFRVSSDYPDSTFPQSVDVAAYIDEFILNLKLVEEGKTWVSFLQAKLEGCFSEMSTNTTDWTNLLCGISLITLIPQPTKNSEVYVRCGSVVPDYKKNSLYENPDINLVQRTWDLHISAITEKVLNDRAPAVAIDFISSVEMQPENWIDNYPSEPLEKTLMRFVVGVLEVNITAGLVERALVLARSYEKYDYPAYTIAPLISGEEISIHLRESNSRVLEGLVPLSSYQFTLVEARVKLFPATANMSPSRLKLYNDVLRLHLGKKEPFVYLLVKSLDCSCLRPMYPDVLIHLQSLVSPSPELVQASKTTLSVSALSVKMGVKLDGLDLPDMFELYKSSCSGSFAHIFQSGPEVISFDLSLQLEQISLTSTKARLMLGYQLLETFLDPDSTRFLFSSSLIPDALTNPGFPYFQLTAHKMSAKYGRCSVSETASLRLGSATGKTYLPSGPQVEVLSADPGVGGGQPGALPPPLFELVGQRPLSDLCQVPFLLYFKLAKFHLILDSSVFKWLLYMPQVLPQGSVQSWATVGSCVSRKISSSSISSLSKKQPEAEERVEEKVDQPSVSPPSVFNFPDFSWLMKWLSIAVTGEVSDVLLSYRGEGSCTLHASIPTIEIISAQGKFTVSTDSFPIPYGVLKRNSVSFPVRLELTGMRGWSSSGGLLTETFISEFSTTCTVALTSSVLPSPVLSFTLHVDTSHVSLSLRRLQMACLAEFWANVMKVINLVSFYFEKVEDAQVVQPIPCDESPSNSQTPTTVINQKQGLAPPAPAQSQDKYSLKFSWWLQWTLTKLTVCLYSTPLRQLPDFQKLSFDFEDIIASIEVDPVYQKLKMKIGSSTIKHYTKDSSSGNWKPGSYGGCMMCAHESSSQKSEFLSLTCTRANAANLHSKLASLMKITQKDMSVGSDRHVIEVVMTVEPLDFILAPSVLHRFTSIVEPLLAPGGGGAGGGGTAAGGGGWGSPGPPLTHLTTAHLPLVYFDLHQVRVFLCSSAGSPQSTDPDTFVIQIDDIGLRSEAVNPVSRKLLRPDVTKVTSVPGSRFEDRQYQLDLSLQIMTGTWKELEGQVCSRGGEIEENPAVTWNTLGSPQAGKAAHLSTVLQPLATSFIFAPPILNSGMLVSGLYFEGNLVSELELKLSTDEFKLGLNLLSELHCVIPSEPSETFIEVDSGIESADGSIPFSFSRGEMTVVEEKKLSRITTSQTSLTTSTSINTRSLRERTQVVPSDILLTAKGVTLKLYSKEPSSSARIPLLYANIAQPYISYEKQGDSTIYKGSVFDLTIRHGEEGRRPSKTNLLDVTEFVFCLAETRDGDPDPFKGIPPALANFKSTASPGKLPAVDLELGRPLKIVVNPKSIRYLQSLRDLLLPTSTSTASSSLHHKPRSLYSISDSNVRASQANIISALSLSTKQLAVEYVSINPEARGERAVVSLSELQVNLNFLALQVSAQCSMRGLLLSLGGNFILTPWSFSSNAILIRESWTPGFIFRLSLSSDVLALEYFSPQISTLRILAEEIQDFILSTQRHQSQSFNEGGPRYGEETRERETEEEDEEEEDESYLDDLQTGAFQFSKTTDLPLPYQVTFPSPAVIAWAYPYPRFISALSLLPVPFVKARPAGLELFLEYLDPLEGWCRWAKGNLTEDQVTKVRLPQERRAASLWRIIIDADDLPIDVKALGGSVRVDSVFSRKAISRLQIRFALDRLSVCAWSKASRVQPLRRYSPVGQLSRYPFATLSLQSLRVQLHSWKTDEIEIKIDSRPKIEILNACTLKEVTVLHPFPLKVYLFYKDGRLKFKVIGETVTSFISPSVAHSIHSALTGALVQPYIICNNTTYMLSFGQVDTQEDIPLSCLQNYCYSWRNASCKLELRFSIGTSQNKAWSRGVGLNEAGSGQAVPLEVTDDGGRVLIALISFKRLSSVVIQITFSGELTIKNRLDRGMDVRIVPTLLTERQRIIQVAGEERCPGVLLARDCSYSLRVALTSGWSGPIPLAQSTSWLVKVPHKGNGNYLSTWCQVLIESSTGYNRILVLFSPMYMIKSLLPGDATVAISTPELGIEMKSEIPGRGSTTNLYTPGTTHHQHSFTFNIVGNERKASDQAPHIRLSYRELSESSSPLREGGGKPEEDVEGEGASVYAWPFLGMPWAHVAWRPTSQPPTLTRVKVRYSSAELQVPHSIQIDLEPWCLVVNTLGSTMAIASRQDILCRVPHLSIVAPPFFEDNFQILVKFSEGGYHKSSSFQLSENQSFYKPHIPGLIPLDATLHFKIQSPNSVLYGVLSSHMIKNIRLLHYRSAFVISNLTKEDLWVRGFSLLPGLGRLVFPPQSAGFVCLPRTGSESAHLATPLTEWLGRGDAADRRLYLVFKSGDGLLGNPIPVPLNPDARERETLLLPSKNENGFFNTPLSVVFQEKDGTTYITLDTDPSPQLIVHNHTGYNLLLATSATPQGGSALEELPDWDWRLLLPRGRCGYYRVKTEPGQPLPSLVVSLPQQGEWSSGISASVAGGGARLVTLPGAGDLVVTVSKVAFTTHLTLLPAHQSLISAAHVRSRLSQISRGEREDSSWEEIKRETGRQDLPSESCKEGCLASHSFLTNVEGSISLQGLYFTLCTDSPHPMQVLSISMEDILAVLQPNPEKGLGKSDACLSVGEVQVDNQKYANGGYDFAVVMLARCSPDSGDTVSPAVQVTLALDLTFSPVLEEVEACAMPFELFLEDTYLMELKGHFQDLYTVVPMKTLEEVIEEEEKKRKKKEDKSPSSPAKPPLHPGLPSPDPPPLPEPPSELYSHHAGNNTNLMERGEMDDEDWPPEEVRLPLPPELLASSYELSRPLRLNSLVISPIYLKVSLHTSTKFYIALDQSPLSFAEFKRNDIVTSTYRLGHALSVHYFLGAIYGTGWALGSLQLLGAPAGLARSLGAGLTSLVNLPYQGLAQQGPAGFLVGVFHGSASLMRHLTAGTLSCVTKLAGSWSRTLDRLTLGPDDLKYAEEMRRLRPIGLADGLKQGLTEFGVSLLGGVGGLAQRPLEYALGSGGSLVGSVSRGLVGAMARPLAGAAGLLAVTTQGILAGAGWAHVLKPKEAPDTSVDGEGRASRLLYGPGSLLVVEARGGDFRPCDLVLTKLYLKAVHATPGGGCDGEELFSLAELVAFPDSADPTLVLIYQQNPADVAQEEEKLSERRVAEFVRQSQRALGSPIPPPPTPPSLDSDPLLFSLNPEVRDYFLAYLHVLGRQATNKGFPLL